MCFRIELWEYGSLPYEYRGIVRQVIAFLKIVLSKMCELKLDRERRFSYV